MALPSAWSDIATDFWYALERLQTRIEKSTAVNVNTENLRDETREFVKQYFGEIRPIWEEAGIAQEAIDAADASCQELVGLANGANKRIYYKKHIRILRA